MGKNSKFAHLDGLAFKTKVNRRNQSGAVEYGRGIMDLLLCGL